MKKALFLTCFLALMLPFFACENLEDYQVTIEIAGDPGIAFTGWYITAYTGPDSTTANGTTPVTWTVAVKRNAGDGISGGFLIDSLATGTMIGRLIADGDTVDADTTAANKPAFHLAWIPE